MRGWLAVPIVFVFLVVVGLPIAALTDTGLERDARKAFGISTGECEPITNEDSAWVTGPDLPFDLDEPRATAVDGRVYLVGGITGLEEADDGRLLLEPSDQLTQFDPKAERYKRLARLPRRLNHIGVFSYDHELYVLGGYGRTLDANTSKAFYRYSPASDRWSRMPNMPDARAAMAVGAIGDRLIVAGGAKDHMPLSDTFAFDFRTQRWSRLPDMPSRREHVGFAVLGNRLYVLGGRGPQTLTDDRVDVYDGGDGRWKRLPRMPMKSGGLTAVAANGKIIAVGGGNDAAGTVTGAVQEWDPQAARWSLLSAMRTPRHGHGSAIVDGRVWVFGGSPCAYFNATKSVEWLHLRNSAG